MSRSVVYLFVDANLFLQCGELEDLNWSAWTSFDEVRLIVSAPILREIDYRKNKGDDRAGRRARATSSKFRKMLGDGYKLVRAGGPCVKLFVEPHHKCCDNLKEQLNYQERDDQLIGTIYEFAKHNPNAEVRLLTHDTTPLYIARAHGLATDVISDEWLLPPESNEFERELRKLREENARIKKAEPKFEIQCLDSAGSDIKRYEGTFTWFDPLTNAKIDKLMLYLRKHFPPANDFGPQTVAKDEAPQTIARSFGQQADWVPATDEEIKKYREEDYPQWLTNCEVALRNYHETLQAGTPIPRFVFLAENCGTRPATDALITVEVEGSFEIKPPTREEEKEGDKGDGRDIVRKNCTTLLPPPAAPRGRWETRRSLADILGQRLNALNPPLIPPLVSPIEPPRDPNTFYYKHGFSEIPQKSFALECAQWRHEDGKEQFDGEIHFSNDIDIVKGALVFRIQAGNLSNTQGKRIPVQIKTEHVGSFDHARARVERLVHRQELGANWTSGETGSSSHK